MDFMGDLFESNFKHFKTTPI